MDYIANIHKKLSYFTSVLNIKYDINYNEFIFALDEVNNSDSLTIFLKHLLTKLSEKFDNSDNEFVIYLVFFTTILIKLEQNPEYDFEEARSILLYPFNEEEMVSKSMSESISQLQIELENDLLTNYNHLFLKNEILLLSVGMIKSYFDSEDLTQENIFVKSLNIKNNPPASVKNGYIITVDSNKRLSDHLIKNKFNMKLAVLSEKTAELIMSPTINKEEYNYFETFLKILIQHNITILFTNKRLNNSATKQLQDIKVFIIDGISKLEFLNIMNIFENNFLLITNNLLFSNNNNKNSEKEINSKINIEILHEDKAYLHLLINTKEDCNLCNTIILNKYTGKIDSERRSSVENLIAKYKNKILFLLGTNENFKTIQKKDLITFQEYQKKLKQNNHPLIKNTLKEIDKQLFYKFHPVVDELSEEDLSEIRSKVIISEGHLKEILSLINMLINN